METTGRSILIDSEVLCSSWAGKPGSTSAPRWPEELARRAIWMHVESADNSS